MSPRVLIFQRLAPRCPVLAGLTECYRIFRSGIAIREGDELIPQISDDKLALPQQPFTGSRLSYRVPEPGQWLPMQVLVSHIDNDPAQVVLTRVGGIQSDELRRRRNVVGHSFWG